MPESPAETPGPTPCDVFVIGGGPAGSTVATLLAREGRRVVIVEQEHHPRFHIGESLLPANVALFEKLGVRGEVERIGMPKWGIEFISPQHDHSSFLEFADAWDKSMPMAWQVRRSELDEILFRHAEREGATAIEGCQVRKVAFDGDGADIEADLDDGTVRRWRARYVVDASGRDTLLSKQFGFKRRNPRHNSAAIFGHFTGARRLEGKLEGNISIFWFEHGWFWFIPLADGSTSVGAVAWPYYLKSRRKPLKAFFEDTIAMAPGLARRLEGATLIGDVVHATGNYSYDSSDSSGERFVLVGDAFAFVDPVFSSGVYLAMASAFKGAELVSTALDRPAEAAAARSRYHRHMVKGPREFSWFIFRMTNPGMRGLFMYPRNPLRVKEAVLALLAGDIFGGSPIWVSLFIFKLIYYAGLARHPLRTLAARRQREQQIRELGALEGETIIKTAPR